MTWPAVWVCIAVLIVMPIAIGLFFDSFLCVNRARKLDRENRRIRRKRARQERRAER